jgi:hypothetical protein
VKEVPIGKVDQCTFETFVAYVEENSLTEKANDIGIRTRRAWNYAARTVPEWPKVFFVSPSKFKPRVELILRPDLSPTLQAEIEQFRRKLVTADRFGDSDRLTASPLATTTANEICKYLKRLAELLARNGIRIETCSELVRPDIAALSLNLLWRKTRRRSSYLYGYACALCSLADRWCPLTEQGRAQLGDLRRKFKPTCRTNAQRCLKVAPILADEAAQRTLLQLPLRLFERASRSPSDGRRAAILMQMAAAIELLLVAPLWPKYLARLEIGRTLTAQDEVSGPFRIMLPSTEVHTRQTFDYNIPLDSSRIVRCYIQNYRTRLCEQPSRWLFPGVGTKPKRASNLSEQITQTIERATGLHCTPLSLRYLVGALYLTEYPGTFEVVRQAFGHRALLTTRYMYRDLSTVLATARFDAIAFSRAVKA